MFVRLLTSRVENGGHTQIFGDIINVSDAEGQRMIDAGLAERTENRIAETAMLEASGREGPQRSSLKRV